MEAVRKRLFSPVDVASLVAFRVMFGLLMAWESAQALAYDWIEERYVRPTFLFKYLWFEWVAPLPGWGMHAVFAAMGIAGLALAAGLAYRAACVAFFVLHTYVFLLSPEYYLNHAYLISVVGLLMALVPAHRALSVDVLLRPSLHARKIPAWPLWLLCGVISIVFFYGGVAKLDADWLAGEPLRHWFRVRARSSPVGALLEQEATVKFVAYTGAIFDLTVPFFLAWRRTRPVAVAASMVFHLSNDHLFDIGVFPWFMLAATTLFFDPSWPRTVPGLGSTLDRLLDRAGAREGADPDAALAVPPARQRAIVAGLAVFAVFWVLLPLRHLLYPGDVGWNEEGHYFSWRMKLRHKEGTVDYVVKDRATGREWKIDPELFLTRRQAAKIVGKPDLILQFAHHLRDEYARRGMDVEVRCNAFSSLNYRPLQRFVDPTVDLARERRTILPYEWVVPFEPTPLPGPVALAKEGLAAKISGVEPPAPIDIPVATETDE